VIGARACSLDCLFCQAGLTSIKTSDLQEFVSPDEIDSELRGWFASGGKADVLTYSGSGEPTLNSSLGEIIRRVRSLSSLPQVLLSNGTLMHIPEVREAATNVDIVKVSLSSWDDASFNRLNRPCDALSFNKTFEGERQLRRLFDGEYWVEVIIVQGINDKTEDVKNIASLVAELSPDVIHLNTVVRTPAEASAQAVSHERLLDLAKLFTPEAEVLSSGPSKADPGWRRSD
jgi:wyosine [tRNA(Phe)-imidazoG37] synthetase (radical SAM superfamily)